MELKQLQSFCAVVQYRSFTRAAEKLYLSQPTVSTHIRQLEEEFGSRLIVRTTKSIEVTPRGQELYACACGIVHLRDDLLRSWSDEDEKVIRIGASTIPSAYILPQILPAFRREHPAPQFHVFQSDSEGIAEGLLTGSFDVGLIGARIHEEALELTPFYEDRMVLITPVNEHFRQLAAQGVTVEDICREPMLLREKGSGTREVFDRVMEAAGLAVVPLWESVSNTALLQAAGAGLGVAVLSRQVAADALDRGLVGEVSVEGLAFRRQFRVVWHRERALSSLARAFLEEVLPSLSR